MFYANNEDTPSLIEPIVVDSGGAPPTARFDSEDEIAPLGGASWNDPLVWSVEQAFVPGGVPNHAGDRAFFAPPNNAPRARAVSIDNATVTLGTLDIDDVFGGNTLISSNAGTLQMQVLNVGMSAQHAVIQQRNTRGNALAEISAPVELMNPLDVHINSSQGMTISGPINTAGGVISTPITKFGPGKLTLSGSLNISGELNVQEGELALVDGAIASAGLVLAQPGSTLTLSSGGAATFNAGIEAVTAGSLNLNLVASGNINVTTGFLGGGPITLNNPAGVLTFRGPNNNFGTVAIQSGRIVFDGQGTMNAASAFDNDGAMEVVVGTGSLALDRIGNAAFIRTRGTLLRFSGTGSETFGNTVIDGGTSRISLQSATGLTVVSSVLQRQNSGVLLVAADNLGTVGGTRLFFSIPPNLVGGGGPAGSTNISILPFASSAGTGTLNVGTSLLTYDGNGLRPLSVGTEYLNNIAGAPSTSNVRVTASQNLAAPQTINALVVAGSVSISGAPTLTISSGALLMSGSGTISTPINFGSAEGVVTVGTSSGRNFTGSIFGTGGVTKAGNGVAAFLSGGNQYSGPTTVVAGQLNYAGNVPNGGAGPLGNGASTITLAAGGDLASVPPSLIAVAAGTTSFARPLNVRGNRASTFGSDFFSGRTVVMNGAVSVQSGLNVVGPTTIFNGATSGSRALIASHGVDAMLNTQRAVVELNASNTFSGGLNVDSGVFRLGHDNAAGTGPIRFVAHDAFDPTYPGPGAIAAVGARTIANRSN